MPDFAALRRAMVDSQVRTSDVTDHRLLEAMYDVPRERFMPEAKKALAYLDLDVPVSAAGRPVRRLLKPMVLAKLIQAAEISEADHVLDIGCASGYSAALLGRLAKTVVALEEDPDLAANAKTALASLGAANVTIAAGALSAGWPQGGPYDVIVLEGATEMPPEGLRPQLKEGGRLVCVLGRGPAGKATIYRSQDGELSGRMIFDAAAQVLPGFARKPEFVF